MEKIQKQFLYTFIKNLFVCTVVPIIFIILYQQNLIVLTTLKLSLIVFTVIFIVFPITFSLSWTMQRSVLFLNFLDYPKDVNYNKPEEYGLPGARNIYVKTDENINLGVWEILPNYLLNKSLASNNSLNSDDIEEQLFDKAIKMGHPIMVYMHGNSGNRAAEHRVLLYQKMRQIFHIFAFDYGGYGDSTYREPNEMPIVNDSCYIIKWLKNRTDSPLFVWGHSLGTGVATHALDILSNQDQIEINGLILESPFNNLHDEIAEHPFAAPFKDLPWFNILVPDAMYKNGLRFESDKHILNFNTPVIILHAQDDGVVPFHLGKKLYEWTRTKRTKKQGTIEFYEFEKSLYFGHLWICRAPRTLEILKKFVKLNINNIQLKYFETISM